jgi:hypothetical protein
LQQRDSGGGNFGADAIAREHNNTLGYCGHISRRAAIPPASCPTS